jgi:protein phosphatase 1 regulatory subunit 7
MHEPAHSSCSEASDQGEEDSTEFRLGVDIEINTDDEEIVVQHVRVKRIENIEKVVDLKKLSIIASCVDKIEGIGENKMLEHFEIYQGLLQRIENISHLTNLRVLDLSFNKIKKIEGLETLVNLEKLYLSNNRITVIEGIESLKNLRLLELGANRIRRMDAACLINLGELEELWLGKNKIENMSDLDQCSFPKLKQLSLQSNRLTRWSQKLFSQVAPNLTNIYLGTNGLMDPSTEVLGALNPLTLEEFDVSCNRLTKVPNFPKCMNALSELWLNDNLIDSTETFGRLKLAVPNLKTIYLERNPVQKQCPLDYRNTLLENLPATIEQVDAVRIPNREIRVASSPDVLPVKKSILKH